ncbi:MAG: DNA ligase D, partial [Hyphomonadaceae bacterium]
QLWDRGFWRHEGPKKTAEESLNAGELKFSLNGRRLRGSWVLVRLKNDRIRSKRTNWLLIKHRDEAAREGDDDKLLDIDASVASGRAMAAIAAGKGRMPKPFMRVDALAADAVWQSKDGAKDAPAKRAPKPPVRKTKQAAHMPDFVAPQLCRLVERAPTGADWAHEAKLDGYRLMIRVENGKARVRTRTGLDWTDRFDGLARAAVQLPDCMLDGEACVLDERGVSDFSALQAALSDGDARKIIFFAFDLLFAEGEDVRPLPLAERKARLEALLKKARAGGEIQFVSHFSASGAAMLDAACRVGLEGVVSKRLDAPYSSGRGGEWTKAKCRAGQEVVIGGWSSENGRFRSLLVGAHEEGKLRYLGRVGTGYNHAAVTALLTKLKAEAADLSPFDGAVPRGLGRTHWVKPVLVAEIAFAGFTGDGRVRQAAYKGLREDKPARDVKEERGEMAKAAKKTSSKTESAVRGVAISHPDKALWPKSDLGPALTKRDLADYFDAVADYILPHIKGRPASLVRAPDGLTGERFFQRHAMKGASEHFTLVAVRGDKQPYVQIDSAEALIAAAQIAAIEIHPWNCAPGAPETPGRLVFDIDPDEGLSFDHVIAAARDVKARLEDLGLNAFCKTTGGKGLHVVTPLSLPRSGTLTWADAKAFARALCAQMAADSPEVYVVNMAKSARKGRMFLDYLRNDRTATAVAPYSPRLRAGATISMPISWTQVKPGLEPARFNLRSAPALIRRSKAWADYDKAGAPLGPAIKKLAGKAAR